jgi:hypothetical protein
MATVESTIPGLLLVRVAELVLSPALPVSYPDIAFTPPVGPYLEVRHMPNTNINLFIGNDATVQYQGLLQITVVYPAGQGIIKPSEVAGLIASNFAKGTVLRGDGVKVRIYQKPSVASSIQDTDRIRMPVTIPYQVFH